MCLCVAGCACVWGRKWSQAYFLFESTSMLKRDWVMTQIFLKPVSIQHVACNDSWISYNKHLFVKHFMCRSSSKSWSCLSYHYLTSWCKMSVTEYQATVYCLCLFSVPLTRSSVMHLLFRRLNVSFKSGTHSDLKFTLQQNTCAK